MPTEEMKPDPPTTEVYMPDGAEEKPRLYNRVKTLRREEGLSREEVCAVLGIGQQTLAHIEREEASA